MPFIPAIPPTSTEPAKAIPFPGVLGGYTTGTITTFDPTLPLQAIAVQLQQIQGALNGGEAGAEASIPGSLLAILNSSQQSLASIDISLLSLRKDGLDALLAVTDQTNSVQQSIATIASMMSLDIALKQMALADQIKHNQFVQTTTNTSRQESFKTPIEVSPDNFQKQASGATKDMATISAQAWTGSAVLSTISQAATGALTIGQGWLADTAIGQDILKRISKYQAQGEAYMAKQKAAYADAIGKASSRPKVAAGPADKGTSVTAIPDK
jgi:hypothetical protein